MALLVGQDEERAGGAGVLDGDHHQPLDEPGQHDLARHGLRHVDHRGQIQVLQGRADGLHLRRLLARAVAGIEAAQRPEGAPALVGAPRLQQVRLGAGPQLARLAEAGGQLVAQRLDVDEPVGAGVGDRLLVQAGASKSCPSRRARSAAISVTRPVNVDGHVRAQAARWA